MVCRTGEQGALAIECRHGEIRTVKNRRQNAKQGTAPMRAPFFIAGQRRGNRTDGPSAEKVHASGGTDASAF